MPSQPPTGDPVPSSGPLPESHIAPTGPLSLYLHVPFCTVRCGYCDFNTYTADELGGGASRATYIDSAVAELRRVRDVFGGVDRPISTVFVGGGTPTLLPPTHLANFLSAVRSEFGLMPGAEVTTEANPESVSIDDLIALADGGFTRISFGMQSAVPSVLATLDRTHRPGRALAAVAEAREAGFRHVNVDLIYGAPGESASAWRASLDAAVASGADHVSAYALIVEDGTALAARVRRGELPMPDDDVLADRYEVAEDVLTAAGLDWYEVSNWSQPGAECRHNLAYWRSNDWVGIGPGAHSHVGGIRWWNVRHPADYARLLAGGGWPAQAHEHLGPQERRAERLMLGVRLAEGLPADDLPPGALAELVADGLLDERRAVQGRAVATRVGRLLADRIARRLLEAADQE